MIFPPDYAERVYAGVLGKIIGVYLGRPVEGWTHEQIMAILGEISYYVNDRHDLPLRNHQLVVTDDDISGTFTFLRALPDYNNSLNLTPAQIGQTWLNYIIENRTILWWGGLGNSTEHTAFLRLKDGIAAPHSGSMGLNGKVVAEQIGAQIFIDGWELIAPGDPALAADLARRAASVSHDGEAIYGAQVIAALIAQAFTETNLDTLIDSAVAFIPAELDHLPPDCRYSRLACQGWPGLVRGSRKTCPTLRLRQIWRQLPHRSQSRPDYPQPALQPGRFSSRPDHRQHLWLGHGL